MANVAFKKGLATNLPWKAATEGVFYLTSDTNRLYVGKADNTLAELNRYVAVVDSISLLPTNPAKDDFVYIAEGNILAVCTNPTATSTADKWTQINPDTDTNTDTRIDSVNSTVTSSADGGIKIELSLNPKEYDVAGAKQTTKNAIKHTITISANDLMTANKVDVDLAVKEATSGATIALSGHGIGNNANEINIVPGNNVTITPDATNGNITIAATDTLYSVSATGNKIRLSGGGKNDDVALASGNDAIALSTASDTITFTHKDYGSIAASSTTPSEEVVHGGTFKVIDSVTTDKGHVTAVNVKQVQLPADNNYTYSANEITADNTGKLSFSLKGANGGSNSSKTSGQVLYYMVNGEPVYNQGTIDFYTKAQIDNKFNGIDAMTYKGTVNSSKTLPDADVKVGDTYKVASAGFSFIDVDGNTITCEIGDLIIASGTETNGAMSGDAIKWNYVPAGDDTDTKYTMSVANNIVTLSNSVDSKTNTVKFEGDGNNIAVSTNGSTIKVAHETINATAQASTATDSAPANGGDFTVVDGFEFDNGHIVKYNTKKITLPTINASSLLSAATDAKIQLRDEGTGSSGRTTTVQLTGDSEEISTSTVSTGNSGIIKVAHASHEAKEATSALADTTPTHQGSFKVMDGITVNGYGHVTGYTTKTVTLPKDNNALYNINNSSVTKDTNNTYVVVDNYLKAANTDGTDSHYKVRYASDSLKVSTDTAASGENAKITIDLEWGSFT